MSNCSTTNNIDELKACCANGNLSDPKTALYCCKVNSLNFLDITDKNIQIKAFNDSQSQQAGAAQNAWNVRKQNYIRDVQGAWDTNWTNEYNAAYNNLGNVSKETVKSGCGASNQWCIDDYGGDWYSSGVNSGWCGACCQKSVCKYTDAAKQRIAKEIANQKMGVRPPDFSELYPKDGEGDFYHKGTLPISNINIQCCSNEMKVSGNARNNIQECNQKINEALSAPPPAAPTPAPTTSSTTTTTTASFTDTISENWEVTGGIFLFLFMCSSASSLILILLLLAK